MGENSKIEWTTHTFNPWIGCQKVGPGCDHCYAEDMMDKRYGRVQWGPHGSRVRTADANWKKPLAWNRAAAAAGERHRVFCASLADWADTHKSISHTWREDLGDLIEATPNLDWLLLTKRIGNADEVLGEMFTFQVPSNVWIGITVVNQAEADRDIPKLLALAMRRKISRTFLSIEPLLGVVDLEVAWYGESALDSECWGDCSWCKNGHPPLHNCRNQNGDWEKGRSGVDWIIVGGESGPNARPMHPDWARSLRDQCAAAAVPFLFKQWGEWAPGSMGGDDERPIRVGKKAAGRLLDGREHNGMPEISASVEGRAA